MIIYSYDIQGEFIAPIELSDSDRDPMQLDQYLIPAKCTLITPPDAQAGFARVFDGLAWAQIEDHRGETWYDAQGNHIEITEIGAIPNGLLQTKPPKPPQQLWNALRSERNEKLMNCDWTQLPDVPIPTAKKAEWASYRQLLRDFPQNITDPSNYTWPSEPIK
jgi:hypothetical protein